MSREALGLWIGVPAALAAPRGFAAADYAPDPEVAAAWARACRLDPPRVESFALQRWRALDRYVWAYEAGGAFMGCAVCSACLQEDATGGRDHYIRRFWLQVEALCARDTIFLSSRTASGAGRKAFVSWCWTARRGSLAGAAGGSSAKLRQVGASHRLGRKRCLPRSARRRRTTTPWRPRASCGRSPSGHGAATARFLARRPSAIRARHGPRSQRAAFDRGAGWRAATWIGVEQLLDRAGAREVFGPPRFTLDQLKAWTRPAPPSRPRELIKLRPAAAYRSMAERILARAECATAGAGRNRLIGQLMREALDCA